MKKVKELIAELKDAAQDQLTQDKIDYDALVRETLVKRPLSYSSLKAFQNSPQHYIEYITKERTPPTDAMKQGLIFDVMLLTPWEFEKKFIVQPAIDRRTKAGKEAYADLLQAAEGKTIIKQDQYDIALDMVKSLFKNADAMKYVNRFKFAQNKIEWTDPGTKLKCIGYYDGESDVNDKDYFICDIKSAQDASEEEFIRAAHKFGYHLQAGGYTSAAKARYFKFPDFIHVVVETKKPYPVNVFRAPSKYIEQSQSDWTETLKAFKFCLDNNYWFMSYEFHRLALPYCETRLPGWYKPPFGGVRVEYE